MLSIWSLMSASMRTGPSTVAPGRMAAPGMRRMRMPKPPVKEKLRSSTRRSPSGRKAASVTSNGSVRLSAKVPARLAAEDEAAMVAGAVERAFGDGDNGAGKRPVGGRHGEGLEALVRLEMVHEFRQRQIVAPGARRNPARP